MSDWYKRVVYDYRHEAIVEGLVKGGEVRIRFDDQVLIPPVMDVPAASLSYRTGGFYNDPRVKCPVCGTDWTRTNGFREVYHDCLTCSRKREEFDTTEVG